MGAALSLICASFRLLPLVGGEPTRELPAGASGRASRFDTPLHPPKMNRG